MKGIAEAIGLRDAQKLSTYYAADAVIYAYGAPEIHGRDDLARTMGSVFSAFGDAKAVPLRTWVKGNVVIAETAWAGTATGDFMGQKATRKAVGQIRASVLSFRDDGLVKEAHEYGDDAGLLAQMTGKKGAPPVPLLPASPPEVHASTGSAEEDRIAAWARSQDDAFNTGDAASVVAGVATDADYWIGISGKPATRGKKDLARELKDWFKAFPDQKWTTTAAWGIDGFGIVEHAMTGTQKGRLGPLPPCGKQVTSWHWLDIVQPSADGKVQHGWGHANVLEMLQQTGSRNH
jgi:ketosteroid isomerase-like protein